MRERILLFIILAGLWAFLYVFQYRMNTIWGLVILLCLMALYGVYTSLALWHNKRKLKKNPKEIDESYKPFVSVMIPAHNEASVIEHIQWYYNVHKQDKPTLLQKIKKLLGLSESFDFNAVKK
jgi:hypothetical protein